MLVVDHWTEHEAAVQPENLPWLSLWPWCCLLALFLLAASSHAVRRDEPTVDELKARVSSATVGDKARLCVQIAEKELTEADRLYAADDVEKAQTTLIDVVSYSELARDYSIQSHKHEKQIEISVRAMTRKLTGILHSIGHNEQPAVQDALKRLERVRDDLLAAMFPKGAK